MTVPTFTEPDAPWGYKADGMTPYKRDPATYAGGRRGGSGAAKAPTRRGTPNRGPSRVSTQARAQAVLDTLTVPTAGLAVAGQALGSKALIADAITINQAAPKISMALAQVADQDERIARIVDSLVQTGPYAALLTALVPVAIQIAANHSDRVAEMGAMFGAKSVDEILADASREPTDTEDSE